MNHLERLTRQSAGLMRVCLLLQTAIILAGWLFVTQTNWVEPQVWLVG